MKMEIVHINEIDSTNCWLKEHSSTQDMVVWTNYQTAGRGCGTNTWESERGKNLLFSILCHPDWIKANRQFLISMSVSVSIARVVEQHTKNTSKHSVSIKWPNDIYVDDNKICGILIENKLQGSHIKESIIGVGLNVNQKVFHSDAPNPVSLIQLLQKELDCELLLKEILAQFSELMNPENETSVKKEYRQRLYRNKGYHIYRDANGEFSARIASVEDDGHLLLRLPDEQERRYAFKEVQFCIV